MYRAILDTISCNGKIWIRFLMKDEKRLLKKDYILSHHPPLPNFLTHPTLRLLRNRKHAARPSRCGRTSDCIVPPMSGSSGRPIR